MRRKMEKWGQGVLAALCIGSILFAALYTRQEDIRNAAARNAAASRDETLEEAQASPVWQLPVEGAELGEYRGATRAAGGLWTLDPWVRCAAAVGQSVRAMGAGTVLEAAGDRVRIGHAGDTETRYRLLRGLRVREGDSVAAGQIIGMAGGDGAVEICALREDRFVDPRSLLE